MLQIGTLASVQVGTPHTYGIGGAQNEMERSWKTSFFRKPDTQSRWLYTTHLEGNAQADTKNHGTLNQAVLLYAIMHYPAWQSELGCLEIGPGGFGENFTVDGFSEETACLGDIYAIGQAQLQVTGPRYPCWKIERRWGLSGLTARVAESGRTGWYCRVLREGLIEPGTSIELVERPHPEVTIALLNDFAHFRNKDVALARTIASYSLLPDVWQRLIVQRAQGKDF